MSMQQYIVAGAMLSDFLLGAVSGPTLDDELRDCSQFDTQYLTFNLSKYLPNLRGRVGQMHADFFALHANKSMT